MTTTMSKPALGFMVVLFLSGCESEIQIQTTRRAAIEAAKEANRSHPNIMERIDGPKDPYYTWKYETEFNDGTQIGCVVSKSGLFCVKLGGQ